MLLVLLDDHWVGSYLGHFGDKIGRKSMLLVTLMLMGIPTVMIGLLPTFESIGYWATICLIILRFIQGMAMGGEWGGAVLMAVEHAPEGNKGFWGSLPQASTGGGLMLASIALGLVSMLPEEALFSWGWRIPFLASIVLLGVGWYIRVKVPESPDFEQVKQQAEEIKVPALQVFKNHPKELLTIILSRAAENAWFGLCVLALYSYPFFAMLNTKDPVLVWTAIVLAIGVVFPIMYAPQSQLFARQFPAEIRYSGISISVQFAGVLGGGLAPLIATKLLSIGGGSTHLVITYIVSFAVIAIIASSFLKPDVFPNKAKSFAQKEIKSS
ncbi:hypothetical protein FQR65_LT19934 [Abscondita terminalis]|nr:hypothetical protein FQR65_LT19934 [Abscondita terminalis]